MINWFYRPTQNPRRTSSATSSSSRTSRPPLRKNSVPVTTPVSSWASLNAAPTLSRMNWKSPALSWNRPTADDDRPNRN